jgi:hypothetical protein
MRAGCGLITRVAVGIDALVAVIPAELQPPVAFDAWRNPIACKHMTQICYLRQNYSIPKRKQAATPPSYHL